jgi:hypothetical protein
MTCRRCRDLRDGHRGHQQKRGTTEGRWVKRERHRRPNCWWCVDDRSGGRRSPKNHRRGVFELSSGCSHWCWATAGCFGPASCCTRACRLCCAVRNSCPDSSGGGCGTVRSRRPLRIVPAVDDSPAATSANMPDPRNATARRDAPRKVPATNPRVSQSPLSDTYELMAKANVYHHAAPVNPAIQSSTVEARFALTTVMRRVGQWSSHHHSPLLTPSFSDPLAGRAAEVLAENQFGRGVPPLAHLKPSAQSLAQSLA